jgi:AcrR family transcriptional regulator
MVDQRDPRVTRSRTAVLGATTELLRELGYAGVSIDAISRLSGVARTTIYRHYGSVAAVVLAALECARPASVENTTDDPVADLRATLLGIIESSSSGLLPLVIEAASRDAEFRSLRHRFVAFRRAEVTAILRRLQLAGQLDADADLDLIGDVVVAPIFYRALVSGEPVDGALVDALIDHVLVAPSESGKLDGLRLEELLETPATTLPRVARLLVSTERSHGVECTAVDVDLTGTEATSDGLGPLEIT